MDERTNKLIQNAVDLVNAAYEKLTAANARIKSLEKKLADGTLTMKEGAELTDLRAQAFGTAFSGKVLDIAQDERESACTELLHKRCDDTDEAAKAAQRAALSRQGLNLTPPAAPFEEDRARKIGHSLEDPTVPDETIQRRAKSATETMIRSQYDRNMKQGAKTCAEAGLKTYIIRDSASGCCKWCDEVTGKFAYGSEPKDVYRRHDNCSCSVVYESGRGARNKFVRQNVWSKQYWSQEQEQKYLELRDELKAKKRTEAPNVKKPVRLSEKDVQAIMAKVEGLTFGANNDNIGKRPYEISMPREERLRIIRQGVSADKPIFAADTATNKFASNVEKVTPESGFYDVALHGTPTYAEFFGKPIDAYLLASIIRNRRDYSPGTPVRLLSCNTGNTSETGDCFAQILANELNTHVKAPNDILWVKSNGELVIGPTEFIDSGDFVPFYSRRV